MLKILEVKEVLDESNLTDNLYRIHHTTQQLIALTEHHTEINADDYNYINVALNKCRIALDKAHKILEIM